MTGPDEISGRKAAGISGRVTVKDKIEYKKVDVTDEIKKESEINVAKEDTAIAPAVESVLQDTVEWVESPKHRQETDRNMKRSASPISRSLPRQDFWSRR